MPETNLAQVIQLRAPHPATPDILHAKRLALKLELTAAGARSWATIILSRLNNTQKPIGPVALSTLERIVDELQVAGMDLVMTAEALSRVLAEAEHRP
jgi:hypothetical protein